MNIFMREMKAHRKSLILWCIGVFYLVAASMWKFGTEYSSNQSLNELVTQLPVAVQVLLGIRGSFDLSTASGYYGLCFYYLSLMAMLHASLLGAGIISKEERDKTTEFLMAKPVSRIQIISAKLLTGFLNIVIFNLVTAISSIIMVGYFNHGITLIGEITTLMIGMFILQLLFMLVGTGVAAVSKNPKSATPVAMVVLLIALMLAKLIDMNSNLEGLKYLTPIKYFEAEQLLLQGGFSPIFLILSVLIIAILLGVTYECYKKRDLKV
jgi:ABC-2 type transport system permease protein